MTYAYGFYKVDKQTSINIDHIVAVSCVTGYGEGFCGITLSHGEPMCVSEKVAKKLVKFLELL